MTVCPGNPEQEGRRFRAIMEAAGAKLDRLIIVEAGDLGYHNLKRLVPKSEAKAFARLRGERWLETHQPAIDEYMSGRCEIVPMREVVSDNSYERRIELIKAIYARGCNPVTQWFDYSLDLDVESRAARRAKIGVLIEPWAIRESALDYLCDEYAMRSLMREQFGRDEIYLGLAVTDAELFQRENFDREIDLRLPQVRPITLREVKMVHVESIGQAVPASEQAIPQYARDLGMVING